MSAPAPSGQEQALAFVRACDLSAHQRELPWLIHGLWPQDGVGLIGGAPKCCKSWLALEMAVSLASNTPCLGTFATTRGARVLLYMAEDAAPVVRSRFEALCRHHQVDLGSLDIFVITEDSLRIDQPRQQQRLLKTVEQIRPDMLLLDPLVRLHRIDENSASEVSALLGFLRHLQRQLQTAVVLVHHTRKNGSFHQPGQALRGSGDLHAFGDSNLYLLRHREKLLLRIEHRAAASPEPIELALLGDAEPHLEIIEGAASLQDAELTQAVRQILRAEGPLPRASLREKLRVRNQRLGNALQRLQEQGHIQRTLEGWKMRNNLSTAPLPPGQQAFRFPLLQTSGNGTP